MGNEQIIWKMNLDDLKPGMRNAGLFEAKQKLSELVELAASGERIGITRRGKLAAVMGLAPAEKSRPAGGL